MSQVSASEHGPVCSRRGYADRGPATLFNIHTCADICMCNARATQNLTRRKAEKAQIFLRTLGLSADCLIPERLFHI